MQTETVNLGYIYDTFKHKHVMDKLIEHFKQLSKQYKVSIVLFTLENIDFDEMVIAGTTIRGDRIRQTHTELPSLIYNLALHSTADKIEKMKDLRKIENIMVINPVNRFIQGIIFEMLNSLPDSSQFLLPTAPFNDTNLTEFGIRYQTLFLLPEKTFLPPKAVVIQKYRESDFMIYIGQNGQMCKKEDLSSYIKKMISNQNHVLMKGVECWKWEEGPLEARIYLQKGASGEWSIATMAAKRGIFSKNAFYDKTLNHLLRDQFSGKAKEIEQTLAKVSLRISRFLDFHIPFLGSCTFDYIIGANGCPYLVYVSGFEPNLYRQMETELQLILLNKTFHYLLFLMNDYETEKGAVNDMDKSSER